MDKTDLENRLDSQYVLVRRGGPCRHHCNLLEFVIYYQGKTAEQVANMAQVMKFNQAAFQKLAIAQVPVQVLPTKSDDNDSPAGFVLVIQGAYAADLRQVDGQNNGCIFFRSAVPPRQIRHLQEDIEDQSPVTNNPAK